MLRTFFKWVAMADYILRIPANGLKPLRQQVTAPRWLELDAEEKLQQALEPRLHSVSPETEPTDRRSVRDVARTLLM